MERVIWNSINKELKDQNIFNTSQYDLMAYRSCHRKLNSFLMRIKVWLTKNLCRHNLLRVMPGFFSY